MNAKKKNLIQKKWIHLKWELRFKENYLKNTAFFKYINRNKRWLVFAPAFFLTLQVWYEKSLTDKWRTKAEELLVENSRLIVLNIGRNSDMEDFDLPWFEKTKLDSIRLTGMNIAYQDIFKYNRFRSLGKTNFDLFDKRSAIVFEAVDSLVLSSETQNVIEPWFEHDSLKILLFSHKWKSKYYDNRIYGLVIPLDVILETIKTYEKEKGVDIHSYKLD